MFTLDLTTSERALLGEVHSQRANSFKGYETSERERATAM